MSHIYTKCIQSGYTPKNGESRILPIVQPGGLLSMGSHRVRHD